MQTILKAKHSYDVLFFLDEIYVFYKNDTKIKEKEKIELVQIAEELVAEVEHKLTTWKPEDSLKSVDKQIKFRKK